MAAFHGPTVATLGQGDGATRRGFFSALADSRAPCDCCGGQAGDSSGTATGRFWCGNLTLLCHLTGTPYQPDFNGGILLIEDQGEAPYRIDRMLTHMRLAGCFDGLGRPGPGLVHQLWRRTDTICRIVADRLEGLGIPIMGGFTVGHGEVNLTLPVDCRCSSTPPRAH